MPAAKAPFLRFLESFDIDPVTGCWNWRLFVPDGGYGSIKVFGEKKEAHRFSYELYKGRIPDGQEVMHDCDNKRCVNPDHLSAGSHQQNMADAYERGLMRRGKPNPRRGVKSNQAVAVIVKGKAYGSINEAECDLRLGSGTVSYWLKRGNGKARIITKDEYYILNGG
jgi:HNH endonuclease